MSTEQAARERRADRQVHLGRALLVAAGIGWLYFANLLLLPYTVDTGRRFRPERECESPLAVALDGGGRFEYCEGHREAPTLVAMLALVTLLTAVGLYFLLRAGYATRCDALKRQVDAQDRRVRVLQARLEEQEARLDALADRESAAGESP